jgi:hypothetical protein
MLTISRLSRWSINYYNDTANKAQTAAMDRQAAGGGLGEYYSESDTRVPTWVVVGNSATVGELTGLDGAALAGGFADTDVAARWLDDGIAPNGAGGRVFTKESVHGFDLTFAAPKSVSLLRALAPLHGPADVTEKTLQNAHQKAVEAAMTYLHQHAGYTRVHNPRTGNKDLERLPGLVGAARHPFGHRGIRSVPRQGTQGTRDAAYRPHRHHAHPLAPRTRLRPNRSGVPDSPRPTVEHRRGSLAAHQTRRHRGPALPVAERQTPHPACPEAHRGHATAPQRRRGRSSGGASRIAATDEYPIGHLMTFGMRIGHKA